jgi:hypothetical protein
MAGTVDSFLKISVAVSLLGAAGSVGYYYSIYLPARDSQVDRDRKIENAKLEFTRHATEQARISEAQAQEDRRAAEKAEIRDRYQVCNNNADSTYSLNWGLNCKRLADTQSKQRSDCLVAGMMQKASCDSIYPARDGSASCALPRTIAADLDGDRNLSHETCLRESQAGLQ